ncbi:MAG: hypothetical protein KDK37_15680 [Leptospiraceae bacterium]|nr:hypothetical protein [Leptospiraceae bacterium]MCB1305728.1 hypothetical protein [Leptospiraceae bacterium]
MAAELVALKSLEERSSVEVVVAHDLDQWHSLVNRGLVELGFQGDPGGNK